VRDSASGSERILSGPKPVGWPPPSAELADDLFEPPLSGERRRQPEYERNHRPSDSATAIVSGATLADLHEDLKGSCSSFS